MSPTADTGVDARASAYPAADHGHAVRASHAHGGGATDEHSGDASLPSHPDGPCDCLGLCHACYAPRAPFAATRTFADGAVVVQRAPEPVQLVARHPARHLRPFAQPPPA